MPRVTSVEPQKKSASRRTKRFNVFLNGEFVFGADEDLVVSYRLFPGKVLSENDLNHLIEEAEMGKLMEKMYGLFSVRQRSEKEVRDYFRIKNYGLRIKGKEERSQMVIDLAVDRLKQKGMINDLEFAKSWVEARRKSKQKGERALRVELVRKGISRDIIEEVLSSKSQVISEEELAKQALEKKMKAWKNLPALEFKKKATEFLMRKGFDYSVVKEVLGSG